MLVDDLTDLCTLSSPCSGEYLRNSLSSYGVVIIVIHRGACTTVCTMDRTQSTFECLLLLPLKKKRSELKVAMARST